jgi:DNA-binding NtrC family response regulator
LKKKIEHIFFADDDADDYFLFSTTLKEIDDSIRISYFRHCDDLVNGLKFDLPDVIVLDLNMPGNDGQKCLTYIKRESQLLHIPVIMYSTSGHVEAIEQAYQNGAHKYIVKPNSVEKLRHIVTEIISIEL